MILLAHLGHWYSALGFLIPAVLVVVWIRFQARRDRRRQEFSQYWTLELRGGQWHLAAVEPAPPSRRQRRSRLQITPPPWSAPSPEVGPENGARNIEPPGMSNGNAAAGERRKS